jgi:hypothetical protein
LIAVKPATPPPITTTVCRGLSAGSEATEGDIAPSARVEDVVEDRKRFARVRGSRTGPRLLDQAKPSPLRNLSFFLPA